MVESSIVDSYRVSEPVLLIGFNRPEVIGRTFSAIKMVQPKRLYVSIDGPRVSNPDDVRLILAVKDVVRSVSWECDVHYLFHESNVGCERNVSGAVSWVLGKENSVIVLEDDVLPSIAFFRFCEDMLRRYYDKKEVFLISGGQFTKVSKALKNDYFFSSIGHTGFGWATWKRAWTYFSLNTRFDPVHLEFIGYPEDQIYCSKREFVYWNDLISRLSKKPIGGVEWDYCWSYSIFRRNGLAIVPRFNLTENHGLYGLHDNGLSVHHCYKSFPNFRARIHPTVICRDVEYDRQHFLQERMPSFYYKLKRKVVLLMYKFIKKRVG